MGSIVYSIVDPLPIDNFLVRSGIVKGRKGGIRLSNRRGQHKLRKQKDPDEQSELFESTEAPPPPLPSYIHIPTHPRN